LYQAQQWGIIHGRELTKEPDMRFSYPIPKTEDDFEHLCCQLLKRRWNLPQLQRYAHRGEEQDGADIFDPSHTKPIRGAQCKLHGYGKTIPPKEIQDEVDKAKKYRPRLEHYTILTTGRKSKQADKKVADINKLHQQQGLFSVEVLTWDQIEILLDEYPDVRDPIYKTLSGQAVALLASRLTAMQAAMEASNQPSDVIDGELDGIKTELERHELKAAQRLAKRLEERRGDKLSPRQRWRLVTLQGNILLAEGELERAGALLLQAKQDQPQEEKAQVNEAIGYEMTGQTAQAHALAVGLRQAFPHSAAAAAVWVRTAPLTVTSEQLEAEVARFVDKECDVALALSICSLNRGDLDRAERHARRAAELEPNAPQAWLMQGQALHVRGFKEVHLERRRSLLRQAEADYSNAIELSHARGNRHLEMASHLNRGIVRDLLEDGGAEEDFIAARHLDPREAEARRRYALHLANQGRADRAVEEARGAAAAAPGNASSLLLAAILWDRNRGGDRKEALDLSLQAARGAETHRFDEALEMALLGLSEFKRWGEAQSLLESLSGGRISEVAKHASLAQLRLEQGDRAGAEELARRAHAAVGAGTGAADLRLLARLLGKLSLYGLALPLLQRIAQPGQYDRDTRMLLACANQLHRHRVILDVCRELREAGQGDRGLLHKEVDILQLYDRPAAIGVLREHLARHPDDRLARLRLSLLALKSEQPDLVTSDPDLLPQVDEAPPATVGKAVVGLLYHTGRWADSLRYAYSLLHRNLSDPDAHLIYCNLILLGEQDGFRIDSADTLQPGMAAAFREKGDSPDRWVVIEEAEEDLLHDELLPSHPLAQELLGKRPGDTISLSAAGIQERTAELVTIQSKYLRRLQESIDQFQVLFPDRGDLQQVRLTREGEDGEKQLDLTPVFASLDRRREHVQEALAVYRKQPTPLHLLTGRVGRHLFQTLDALTENPSEGVRWCCLGNDNERAEALQTWKDARSVVLDLTALYTAHRLNLFDFLRRWRSRKFCVSEGTFDKVRDIVDAETRPGTQRYTATDESGRYFWAEITEEMRRPYIESLQRLAAFVRECCSVVPTPELAGLDPERRDQLQTLFGRDGMQSIALGAHEGHVLWTDDLTLGVIARTDFDSPRRAWTQVVLQAAVDEGALQHGQFNEYSARLIGLGYSFTWSDADIIHQAGVMSEWNCEAWPLRQVIRQFRLEGVLPHVRVGMAAHAIVGMFRTVASPFKREAFVLATLNQLGSPRLAQALASALENLFGVDALSWHEAIGTIRAWRQGPLRRA
jgi:Flp pilus assembly protein TadD